MKNLRPPRTTSELSDSVLHRLNMYALAATAAGIGLVSLGQFAEAKVVYTPTHKWLPTDKLYFLDLNHDGENDFRFHLTSNVRSTGFSRILGVSWVRSSQRLNQIYSAKSGIALCAAALPKGKEIGPKSPGFRNRLQAGAMFFIFSNPDCTSYFKFGPWLDVKGQAYVGVRFAIKGKVHYGWARLGSISHNKPVKALLTGYAYETIPNKPIVTGKTKGPDVITMPLGGTLGHLALGRK